MKWTVRARGHPNITASHRSTLMITRDPEVGPRGHCIIGVGAETGAAGLPEELKEIIRRGEKLLIEIRVGEIGEEIVVRGHPGLPLTHQTDMVVRKSSFLCERTVGIRANKAAADLSRDLVKKLKNPQTSVEVCFRTLP